MALVRTQAVSRIESSLASASAVLGDYAQDPLWRRAVARMEPTPRGMVRDGTHAVEELRTFGRTVVTLVEVYDVEPGRGFAWRAIDGTDAHGTRILTALSDELCELRTERVIRLTGADQLLAPLVSWTLARAERADHGRAAALVMARAAGAAPEPRSSRG